MSALGGSLSYEKLHFPALFSSSLGPDVFLYPIHSLMDPTNYGEGISGIYPTGFSVMHPIIELPYLSRVCSHFLCFRSHLLRICSCSFRFIMSRICAFALIFSYLGACKPCKPVCCARSIRSRSYMFIHSCRSSSSKSIVQMQIGHAFNDDLMI